MPLDSTLDKTLANDLARIAALPAFAELDKKLTRFTPFRVLRVEHYELRHTNTLAWLLDPEGSHGMKHAFLDSFLSKVLDEAAPRGSEFVEVHTELALRRDGTFVEVDNDNDDDDTDDDKRSTRDRLDILVEGGRADGSRWAVAIEAKINSREGANQLARYDHALKKQFEGVEVTKCYLTLDASGTVSSGDWKRICWGQQVAESLGAVLPTPDSSPGIDPGVRAFLLDYLELINELSSRDAGRVEVTAVANRDDVAPALRTLNKLIEDKGVVHSRDGEWAKTYRKHKAAFDTCRSAVREQGAATVWGLIDKMLAAEQVDWSWKQIAEDSKAMRVRFVPDSWDHFKGIGLNAGDGSWNLFYHAEFRKQQNDIEIKLYVAPSGDREMQKGLMKRIFGEGKLALHPTYLLEPGLNFLANFVYGEAKSVKLYRQFIKWEEQPDGTYLLKEPFEQTLAKFKLAVTGHTEALRRLSTSQPL